MNIELACEGIGEELELHDFDSDVAGIFDLDGRVDAARLHTRREDANHARVALDSAVGREDETRVR